MSSFIFSIIDLFNNQFNSDPVVLQEAVQNDLISQSASVIKQTHEGREVLLPTRFVGLPDPFDNGELFLPWTTIKVSSKKNYIRTPLSQRRGTVKELYSTEDYNIVISGFLIDINGRQFPEEQIRQVARLFELEESLSVDNAMTNIFLPDTQEGDKYRHVVINSLDFPPLKGGRLHARPFTMTLESDIVFTLEEDDV